MDTNKISNNMLTRLPEYLNYVKSVSKDVKYISATKIANELELGEVLVRKDLARISDGGRCKLGYSCEELIKDIETFLGIKSTLDAGVVGKGEMIQILLNYGGFEDFGLNLVAGFDIDSWEKRNSSESFIYSMDQLESFFKENHVCIGIIMVSAEDAQAVCDRLVGLGVDGIWNFTTTHLNVPEHVVLQNESIAASITKLRMQLKERSEAS